MTWTLACLIAALIFLIIGLGFITYILDKLKEMKKEVDKLREFIEKT